MILYQTILKKILLLLKIVLSWTLQKIERLDIDTARPREITLEQGTVSLQGFPKEVADALSAHIKNFNKPLEQVSELPKVKEDISLESTTFVDGKALSIRHNTKDNTYEVVTLSYDISSGKAVIDKVETNNFRRDAVVMFKMRAFDLNFS